MCIRDSHWTKTTGLTGSLKGMVLVFLTEIVFCLWCELIILPMLPHQLQIMHSDILTSVFIVRTSLTLVQNVTGAGKI